MESTSDSLTTVSSIRITSISAAATSLIPDLFGRITILNAENEVVTHLGENPGIEKTESYPNLPHAERIPGKFISPHDACWDRAGNSFVVEWIEDGRVTKLQKTS